MSAFENLYSLIQARRPGGELWSMAQLRASNDEYEAMLEWARGLGCYDFDALSHRQPAMLGAVLLWLHSEVLRRRGGDGSMWPVLRDRSIVPWQEQTWGRLYPTAGSLLPSHGKLLERAVQWLGLRHAFHDQDVQKWYQLIYLQFGFTHDDANSRLSAWLSGQILPVGVEKLLQASDPGALEFQLLWRKLRQFRLGNISAKNMEAHLRQSCWVLPEWSKELMQAAMRAEVSWGDDEEGEEEAFFTTPQLVWSGKEEPSFRVELCQLEQLPAEHDLELRCGGKTLRRLLRQPDGGLAADGDSMVVLGTGGALKPQMELRLVTAAGVLVRHGMVTLWEGDRDVSLFRPSDGQLVSEQQLRAGQAFDLLAFEDLKLAPAASATAKIGAGYVLHRYHSGWSAQVEARLDDMVLWTSVAFGAPALPLPVDAVEASWRDVLDFTNEVRPSPWRVGLKVRAVDPAWKIVGLRWTRADGYLMKFNTAPETLSLVEGDIAGPIRLRVMLKHSSGRHASVPVALPPPVHGCLRWPENGRPVVQSGNTTVLIKQAQMNLWSFLLPKAPDSAGMPCELEPNECSLMEGDSARGALRSRAAILPSLAGFGAPAWISRDPYNSSERLLGVGSRVIDGGVIGHVRLDGYKATVPRFGDFDLTEGHRLWAWFSSPDKPGRMVLIRPSDLTVTEAGWEFPLPHGYWMVALVLLYQGERLGSWFDGLKWSGVMLRAGAAEPAQMAAQLRVWKAPMLQEQGDVHHRDKVAAWLKENWMTVLPVWVAGRGALKGPGDEIWPCPKASDDWKSAVQSLLAEIMPRPSPESAWSLIDSLISGSPLNSLENKLGYAIRECADYCPLLAVRLLIAALQAPEAKQLQGQGSGVLHLLQIAYPCTEAEADQLALRYGKRDGKWLGRSIPSLHQLDPPNSQLPLPYRRLASQSEFRKFAFGVWVQKISLPPRT